MLQITLRLSESDEICLSGIKEHYQYKMNTQAVTHAIRQHLILTKKIKELEEQIHEKDGAIKYLETKILELEEHK